MRRIARVNRLFGITLIELLVVVAIIGILAAIALPSYRAYLDRARRADAEAVLVESAQFMERYYTQQSTYVGSTLPYSEAPLDGSTKYYDITFESGEPTANTYIINAVPKGAMADDGCGTISIDQTGRHSVSGSADVEFCWRQ